MKTALKTPRPRDSIADIFAELEHGDVAQVGRDLFRSSFRSSFLASVTDDCVDGITTQMDTTLNISELALDVDGVNEARESDVAAILEDFESQVPFTTQYHGQQTCHTTQV